MKDNNSDIIYNSIYPISDKKYVEKMISFFRPTSIYSPVYVYSGIQSSTIKSVNCNNKLYLNVSKSDNNRIYMCGLNDSLFQTSTIFIVELIPLEGIYDFKHVVKCATDLIYSMENDNTINYINDPSILFRSKMDLLEGQLNAKKLNYVIKHDEWIDELYIKNI